MDIRNASLLFFALSLIALTSACDRGEGEKTPAEKSVEYAEFGLLEESAAEFEKAIAQDPDNVKLRYNFGVALLSLKRFDKAEEVFRKVLLIEPSHALALNNLGVVHQSRKEYDLAVEFFQKAIAKDPKLVLAHQNLALAYKSLGKAEEAKTAYRAALRLEPENEDIKEALRRLEPA